MAQGDFVLYEEISKNLADGSHNLATDSLSVMLITTLPSAADLTPDSSDYTEVTAGGGYSAGGIALSTTFTEAGGVATLSSSTTPSWTAGAGSPTNIVAALVYNTSHSGSNDAIGFIDMTTDAGSTPVSLVAGDVIINWNGGSDMFTIS